MIRLLATVLLCLCCSFCNGGRIHLPNFTIIDVYDGDTFTVEGTVNVTAQNVTYDGAPVKSMRIPVRINIRLIDLSSEDEIREVWAPERTKEEPGWEESRNNLIRIGFEKRGTLIIETEIAENENARLEHTKDNISNLFTMGRLLGDFRVIGFKGTVGRRQVNSGHAWKSKEEQKEAVEGYDE